MLFLSYIGTQDCKVTVADKGPSGQQRYLKHWPKGLQVGSMERLWWLSTAAGVVLKTSPTFRHSSHDTMWKSLPRLW